MRMQGSEIIIVHWRIGSGSHPVQRGRNQVLGSAGAIFIGGEYKEIIRG